MTEASCRKLFANKKNWQKCSGRKALISLNKSIFYEQKLSLHFFKHKQVYSGQDHLNICEQPQFLGEKIYWSGFCLIGFALPIVVTVYCYIRIIQEVQEAKLRVKTIGRNIIKKVKRLLNV